MDQSTAECPRCHTLGTEGDYPNYDHVHESDDLPRAKRTDTHIVVRGYAVGVSGNAGGLPQSWIFFHDLEPALVFGRAGRMSSIDITGYGVYEAARELRFTGTHDVKILHIKGGSLDRHANEAHVFERWIRGCHPRSSHYRPQSHS